MTDPSPEERAVKVAQEFTATPYIDEQWKEKIASEIREAVLAERERCAKVADDDDNYMEIGERIAILILKDPT